MARLAALSAALAFALSACGEDEGARFDADGFVEAMNDQGAGLDLGEPLPNADENVEIYAVSLHEEGAEESPAGEEEGHTHGGGSLTITADEEAGVAEYERCEGAVTLLCYRAGNAVLILEDEIPTDERTAIETAVRGLAEEG